MSNEHCFPFDEGFLPSSNAWPLNAIFQSGLQPSADIPIGEDVPVETMDDFFLGQETGLSSGGLPIDDEDVPMETMDDFFLGQETGLSSGGLPIDDEDVPMESMDVLRNYYRKGEIARLHAELRRGKEPPVPFLEKQGEIVQSLAKKSYAHAEIARQLVDLCNFMRLDKTLYLRVSSVWRKICKEDIPDLYVNLPQEISDGLDDSAAKGIYGKILRNPTIRVFSEDLVENPNLIAMRDGVYDVENGCVYERGSIPDSFLCINAGVHEIGGGSAKTYEAFLSSTFSDNDNAIMRFEETQGAILTTHPLKNIFLYKGERDSGKSVIEKLDMEFLKNTSGYGDEMQHVMPLDNINRLSKQFGVGDAPDRWLILCGDASKVAIKEDTTAMLKQLSGGDYVRGELKHINAEGGFFKGRILLLSNHPLHGALDDALKSRIVMTPFLNSIPKEKQIQDLHKVLYEERGQILYRYFQGVRRLLSNNFNYTPVEDDELWANTSIVSVQDTVEAFVRQRTVRDPKSYTETSALYSAYVQFCEIEGFLAVTDSGVFGRCLRASCPWLESARNSRSRGYRGIRLG